MAIRGHEREVHHADALRGGGSDQRRHARHGVPRVAIGHQLDHRGLGEQNACGLRAVSRGVERVGRRIAVERLPVEVPVVVAEDRAVAIARQACGDLRQEVVDPGIDLANRNADGVGARRHWRVQRLGRAGRPQPVIQVLQPLGPALVVIAQLPGGVDRAAVVRQHEQAGQSGGAAEIARADLVRLPRRAAELEIQLSAGDLELDAAPDDAGSRVAHPAPVRARERKRCGQRLQLRGLTGQADRGPYEVGRVRGAGRRNAAGEDGDQRQECRGSGFAAQHRTAPLEIASGSSCNPTNITDLM